MLSMTSAGKPGPSSVMVTTRAGSVPFGADLDLGGSEVGGILDDVAEPVDDARPALDDRLRRTDVSIRRRRTGGDRDVDAPGAVGCRRLLEHGAHADARVQGILLAGMPGQLLQDLAAALRLALQEPDVLAERAVGRRSRARAPWSRRRWWTSGVPSSCAAAAASPSSACSFCSRASTRSVAASAADICRDSLVSRQA